MKIIRLYGRKNHMAWLENAVSFCITVHLWTQTSPSMSVAAKPADTILGLYTFIHPTTRGIQQREKKRLLFPWSLV